MAEALPQQKLFPYDGQQDSTRHPLLISPTDIVDSDNIIYTTYSTKKKRPGITELFDSRPSGSSAIVSGVDFHRSGSQRIVVFDGTTLRAMTTDGVESNITGNFTLPTDEMCSFEKFSGYLMAFFSGGATVPKGWTMSGSIADISATIPNAPFGRVFLNSLWVPDPSVPGRLLKSQTGSATAFTGGDSETIDLDVNDGDPDGITAIFPPFFGNLYVSKRLAIYKISPVMLSDGSIAYSVAKIIDGLGCNAHNAAIMVESYIMFTSDRGIHALSSSDKISGVDTQFLSASIQPKWVSDTNFKRAKFMQAVYDVELNSYLLIFPAVSKNVPSDVWGYSIAANKWYRWRDYNQTAIFRYIDFNNKKLKTVVGSRAGDIGFIDTSVKKDYGVNYSLYIESGIIAPSGSPNDRYSFNSISPIFVPQNIGTFDLTYKIDGRTIATEEFSLTSESLGDELGDTFVTGESVLGGLPQVKMDTRNIGGYGSFYSLLFEHEATETSDDTFVEDFELLGALVDVSPVQKNTGEVSA